MKHDKVKHEINSSSSAGTVRFCPITPPKSTPSLYPPNFPYIDSIDIDGGAIHGISTDTLKRLMEHPNDSQIVILDCRYPYEFRGGHIIGALNVTNTEDLDKIYRRGYPSNTIFVFHCEFSKNRGKVMLKRFQDMDRAYSLQLTSNYKYDKVFLLIGGYKQFYSEYPYLCVGSYVEMRDTKFVDNNTFEKCEQEFWKDLLNFNDSAPISDNGENQKQVNLIALCDSMEKLDIIFNEDDPFLSSL